MVLLWLHGTGKASVAAFCLLSVVILCECLFHSFVIKRENVLLAEFLCWISTFFSVQRKVGQLLGDRNSRESTAVKVSLRLKEALWTNGVHISLTFMFTSGSFQRISMLMIFHFFFRWLFSFCFRAILCKGAKYPPILPKPTVQILPFEIPVCELKSDKGLLEVGDVLLNLFLQNQSLFAFSCILGSLFLSDEIIDFLILLVFLLVKCLCLIASATSHRNSFTLFY